MSQTKSFQIVINKVEEQVGLLYKKLLKINEKKQALVIKNKILDIINNYFREIKNVPPEQRKEFGAALNKLKQEYQVKAQEYIEKLDQASWDLLDKKELLDLSRPFFGLDSARILEYSTRGIQHPLSRELEIMHNIWRNLGFKIFEGRELDYDHFVFEVLNIPKGHPAREMWDTFYTDEGYVPTTQTSNMQVRMMKYFKQAPVKAAIYGKVFRNEDMDATHSHTFYQYEVVYIDKKVNIGHLIGILLEFLKMYYSSDELEYRIMPAHFPFVEPGIEIHLKQGKKWLEILGAGMIHPVVLKHGGFDPEEYSGFAAGFGIDRMVMLKYGLNDIRDLYLGNLSMYVG